MGCELCETIDWKEDETFKIIICNHCQIPMLVLKEHRQFTEFEKELIPKLLDVFNVGGEKDVKIRWEQRKIKDHGHLHFI